MADRAGSSGPACHVCSGTLSLLSADSFSSAERRKRWRDASIASDTEAPFHLTEGMYRLKSVPFKAAMSRFDGGPVEEALFQRRECRREFEIPGLRIETGGTRHF